MTQPRPAPIYLDLDDTLVQNDAFNQAKILFFGILDRVGLFDEQTDDVLYGHEKKNIALCGFAKDRFPKSLVETYQALCKMKGVPQDAYLRWQIEGFAWQAVYMPSEVMPGVLPTLKKLSNLGHPMFIVTKGDDAIQRKKIEHSGFAHLIDRTFVFPNKTEVEIAQALEETGHAASASWFVGNSKKSDVNPSLRLGMKAAYIPYDTWAFEDEDLLEGYVHVAHITELPSILKGAS